MGKPISQITIVGGGTAGWLSALLLQSLLSKDKDRPAVQRITVIESPNIPTVGVGEATVPGGMPGDGTEGTPSGSVLKAQSARSPVWKAARVGEQ